jgi:hypothetical protein
MPAGRPRTAIPEKDELIELGKQLVKWAEKQGKKNQPLRVRFCDWYTDEGFIRKQWEHMREKPEFQWYYEKARSVLAGRYVDGTVNQSIAHRYLRIYDPELRDSEDQDANDDAKRKASQSVVDANNQLETIKIVLDDVERNKRKPT